MGNDKFGVWPGYCWVLLKPADLSRYDIDAEVREGRVYALLES